MKKIQILGTGCPKCKKLAENAEAAAKALGCEYEIEKVTDINEIRCDGNTGPCDRRSREGRRQSSIARRSYENNR
jgi:thiol-disulfide isomerase/thioredoxin